jgi:bifunctional ADP-heptose synthase (sugar kinase/adenylyltransferase)
MRIDNDVRSTPIQPFDPAGYDAVVFSDYNKGVVTYELVESMLQYNIPVFIDTKKTDLSRFEGCYVKINELERKYATTLPSSNWLITTRGRDGAEYNGVRYPAPDVGDVTDVCGAGDTFLAALVYKYLCIRDINHAINFATRAATVTVKHHGVYAPSLKEIEST